MIELYQLDKVHEALQTLTMKFDKIIMNPPYRGGLHIKILEEALKHLELDGKLASLEPIDKWQNAKLLGFDNPVENTYVSLRISMDESCKLFSINQRAELGIVTNDKALEIEILDNFSLLKKIKIGLDKAIEKAGLLKDKFEKIYKDFPVAFVYGCTIAGNGGHGKACYRITYKFVRAIEKTEIGHSIRYNAVNEIEQKRVYNFYANNQLMRFIYKEFGFGGPPYQIIPYLAGFVDNNGKTALDYDWTFEDLCKYFNLSLEEIQIVENSLSDFLYEEEQKLIESTMEKNTNNLSD